jgi:hypothetical protein
MMATRGEVSVSTVKRSTGEKMHVQHIEEVGFDGVDRMPVPCSFRGGRPATLTAAERFDPSSEYRSPWSRPERLEGTGFDPSGSEVTPAAPVVCDFRLGGNAKF